MIHGLSWSSIFDNPRKVVEIIPLCNENNWADPYRSCSLNELSIPQLFKFFRSKLPGLGISSIRGAL